MKQSCAPLAAMTMLFLVVACNVQQRPGPAPLDTRAADERAIRNLSAEWSKAAGARDLEKPLSYYADDASTLPPNALPPGATPAVKFGPASWPLLDSCSVLIQPRWKWQDLVTLHTRWEPIS